MRIAYIAPPYESHDFGRGRRVRELARGVGRVGGQLEVLASVSEAARASAADEGVTVRPIHSPSGSGYAATRALWTRLQREGAEYDLVHAHGYGALPVAVAGRAACGRVVFSPDVNEGVRGRIGQLAYSPYRPANRAALGAAELVICSSQTQAEAVAKQAPVMAPRVRVISEGVDAPAIARARPFVTERRVILSIGRPGGGGKADRAIAALPDLGIGYVLVIAGCAPIKRRLQARSVDLRVSGQVRILGRTSDAVMYAWMRTAAVVLALSDDDTSAAMMEGACAGVPVIASDTPAHRETARLINDPALRLVSARASPLLVADAIAHAADTHMNPLTALAVPTLESVADQTVSLYSELLDDRLQSAQSGAAPARARFPGTSGEGDEQAIRGQS